MVYQTETANRKPGIWLPDGGKHLANAAKYFIEYLLQWVSIMSTNTMEAKRPKISGQASENFDLGSSGLGKVKSEWSKWEEDGMPGTHSLGTNHRTVGFSSV